MDIVTVGAGGHAKVVIEVFRATEAHIVGLLDPEPSARHALGVPVIGGDGDLPRLRREGIGAAFVAIGNNVSGSGLARSWPGLASPCQLPSIRLRCCRQVRRLVPGSW